MAEKTVVCSSTGENVRLVLNKELSDWVRQGVFDIPQYNHRLYFMPIMTSTGPWVKVFRREPIDSALPVTVTLSDTPYYAMAQWACAIFANHRKGGKNQRASSATSTGWWEVFWRGTNPPYSVAVVKARSDRQACIRGWKKWSVANFPALLLDRMYAVPAPAPATAVAVKAPVSKATSPRKKPSSPVSAPSPAQAPVQLRLLGA